MDADTADEDEDEDENEDEDVTQWHSPKWKGDKEKYRKGIKSLFIVFHSAMKSFESVYDKWNNIPRYIQTEINGRGRRKTSMTSFPSNIIFHQK